MPGLERCADRRANRGAGCGWSGRAESLARRSERRFGVEEVPVDHVGREMPARLVPRPRRTMRDRSRTVTGRPPPSALRTPASSVGRGSRAGTTRLAGRAPSARSSVSRSAPPRWRLVTTWTHPQAGIIAHVQRGEPDDAPAVAGQEIAGSLVEVAALHQPPRQLAGRLNIEVEARRSVWIDPPIGGHASERDQGPAGGTGGRTLGSGRVSWARPRLERARPAHRSRRSPLRGQARRLGRRRPRRPGAERASDQISVRRVCVRPAFERAWLSRPREIDGGGRRASATGTGKGRLAARLVRGPNPAPARWLTAAAGPPGSRCRLAYCRYKQTGRSARSRP